MAADLDRYRMWKTQSTKVRTEFGVPAAAASEPERETRPQHKIYRFRQSERRLLQEEEHKATVIRTQLGTEIEHMRLRSQE